MAINKALLNVQKTMMAAKKDASNPFFKSKYATLNNVWETAKEPLQENGLLVLQPIDIIEGQQVLKTVIIHAESGERIESNCPIICAKPNDPQAMGSAITYARRYSLASILGMMTDEDDDGEKAMARKPSPLTGKEKNTMHDEDSFKEHTYQLQDLIDKCKTVAEVDALKDNKNFTTMLAYLKKHSTAYYNNAINYASSHKKELA